MRRHPAGTTQDPNDTPGLGTRLVRLVPGTMIR